MEKPVSYTHIDVYKRQALSSVVSVVRPNISDAMTHRLSPNVHATHSSSGGSTISAVALSLIHI